MSLSDPLCKPLELYNIIENFCLGTRRLELFGSSKNLRPGWLTIGTDVAPPEESTKGEDDGASASIQAQSHDKEKYATYFQHEAQSRGANLVPATAEVESLRPRSPGGPNRSSAALMPGLKSNPQGIGRHTNRSATPSASQQLEYGRSQDALKAQKNGIKTQQQQQQELLQHQQHQFQLAQHQHQQQIMLQQMAQQAQQQAYMMGNPMAVSMAGFSDPNAAAMMMMMGGYPQLGLGMGMGSGMPSMQMNEMGLGMPGMDTSAHGYRQMPIPNTTALQQQQMIYMQHHQQQGGMNMSGMNDMNVGTNGQYGGVDYGHQQFY